MTNQDDPDESDEIEGLDDEDDYNEIPDDDEEIPTDDSGCEVENVDGDDGNEIHDQDESLEGFAGDLIDGEVYDFDDTHIEVHHCTVKTDFGPVRQGEEYEIVIIQLQPKAVVEFYKTMEDKRPAHLLRWKMQFTASLPVEE